MAGLEINARSLALHRERPLLVTMHALVLGLPHPTVNHSEQPWSPGMLFTTPRALFPLSTVPISMWSNHEHPGPRSARRDGQSPLQLPTCPGSSDTVSSSNQFTSWCVYTMLLLYVQWELMSQFV